MSGTSTHIATALLNAIDEAIDRDDGAAFRHYLGLVLPHMKDAYDSRPRSDGYSRRLGPSSLGTPCGRAVWYAFRWFSPPKKFVPSMLRLFNRGHLEEGRMIALLLQAGVTVAAMDERGKQYSFSCGNGHIYGKLDAILYNVPGLPPDTVAPGEFKTHNRKSFETLIKKGVKAAKPDHYIQANLYAYRMGYGVSVYIAVCKDDDRLYAEFLPLDVECAAQQFDRADRIIDAQQPPERIADDDSSFSCRFCDHRAVCWAGARPRINCRSCSKAVPIADGKWYCTQHGVTLTHEQALAACSAWDEIK